MPKGIPISGINKGWFIKGRVSPNKGVSIVNSGSFIKGHIVPIEVRMKIRNIHKGRKLSEEHKKKIGLGSIGRKNKPISEITRKKMSISHIGLKMSYDQKIKMSNLMKGDKNRNWKGGTTNKNESIRKSLQSKLWKEECMSRDNYTCQKTGQRGGRLVVHHIYNFSQFPELRFDPNNGITFSLKSHLDFHRIYGKQNNNLGQIIEFLKN